MSEHKIELTEFEEEVFTFLDDLRESGDTNMFGAALYVVQEFLIDKKRARELVSKWMETFGVRHPQPEPK